jgi:hypothetical protein
VAKKSNKPSSKVNDVSKPGETPVSSNARPTITGHSPVIKNDPMVAFSSKNESEDTEGEDKTEGKSYVTKSKPKISPISEDLTSDENKEAEDSPEEKPAEDGDKDKPADPADKSNSAGSESAVIDAVAQTADAQKAESKQTEEDQKHKDYIDGLVKEGKYRLPIIEGGHKGSAERFVSWIFLLLLIASIGVYLAIDVGYIQIGFDLPFEFIKD